MRIASVGTALPDHRYDQQTLTATLQAVWNERHYNPDRLAALHHAMGVGGRHLALPLERYQHPLGFGEASRAFTEVGTVVGAEALRRALCDARVDGSALDALFFVTVTGVTTPSLDARLANVLDLRTDLKRIPIFGLGCAGGAAGLARMHDYLRAWPTHAAALVSVELCSLTLQPDDLSIPNLIATGLFGDGAAAVVGVGNDRPETPAAPRVVATRSRFYRDTEFVMGWDVADSGFRIVLSAALPDLIREHLGSDVAAFLADHGLRLADVATWICHPGGPRILEAMQDSLGIPSEALAVTWRSLRDVGNLSSASVLFVLQDTLAAPRPAPGTHAVLLSMGPGFHAEMVLLQW